MVHMDKSHGWDSQQLALTTKLPLSPLCRPTAEIEPTPGQQPNSIPHCQSSSTCSKGSNSGAYPHTENPGSISLSLYACIYLYAYVYVHIHMRMHIFSIYIYTHTNFLQDAGLCLFLTYGFSMLCNKSRSRRLKLRLETCHAAASSTPSAIRAMTACPALPRAPKFGSE